MRNRRDSGFTLMELLVAVGLMVMLMTAIVLIFFRSADVMKIGDARIQIYENARAAIDVVASDVQNALPVDGGQQRLWMENFARPVVGTVPVGNDVDGALDYIGLVTVTTAPTTGPTASRELRTVYVEYFLMNDEDAETSFAGAGYMEAQRSNRRIYVLKRRLWTVGTATSLVQLVTQQLAGVPIFSPMPSPTILSVGAGLPPNLVLLEEGDLCHWVVGFNIEVYYDDTPADPNGPGKWVELSASGHPYTKTIMPVGDNVGTDPVFPRKLRITMRIIEGAGERQERMFQREIWAPLGG